jgi:hypothetical protein
LSAAAPEKPHPDRGSVSAAAPEIKSPYGDLIMSAAALGELVGCSDRNIRDLTKRGVLVLSHQTLQQNIC